MNQVEYDAKKARRRERCEALAAKLKNEAKNRINRARQMADCIPLGQPILIGHHSEGRDRRFRNKIDDNFRKGYSLLEKAKYYERRAATESKAVSADDPSAINQLREQLEMLEKRQALMKAANAAIRKHNKKGQEAQILALVALGLSERAAQEVMEPDFCGRIGFAGYQLTNNNTNIKRIKARIAELETHKSRETKEWEYKGFTARQDAEENRVMFIFPGKPSYNQREILKRAAFKWSPNRGAWVRQWTNAAIYATREAIKQLEALAAE